MPTYLKYKYIFFLHSISGRIRIRIFFQLSRIRIRGKKCRILIPDYKQRVKANLLLKKIYSIRKRILFQKYIQYQLALSLSLTHSLDNSLSLTLSLTQSLCLSLTVTHSVAHPVTHFVIHSISHPVTHPGTPDPKCNNGFMKLFSS